MKIEEMYSRAQEDENLRPGFLESLELPEAVKSVRYSRKPSKKSDRIAMETRSGLIPKILGKEGSVKVFPQAFSQEACETYQDFASSLYNHEGYHAKEILEGTIDDPSCPSFDSQAQVTSLLLTELRALRNEEENFTSKNSKGYKMQVWSKISLYEELLRRERVSEDSISIGRLVS